MVLLALCQNEKILTHRTEVEQDFPTDSMGLIHIAAYYDSLESFLYLIKMGLSPEMRSGNGVLFIFILHLYIMHVQEQHLKLLLTSYRNSK